MSPRWARGRALALRVEPARGLQRPPGRLTIPHAGEGGRPRPSPSAAPHPLGTARRGAPCRDDRFPPGGGPRHLARYRWPLRGHGALAARRPLPVSRRALRRSPDFFASTANAKPGPRLRRFAVLRGAFIRLRLTKLPPYARQSRYRLWHGEELRGTVQARAACTGNRQMLTRL